jgi:hypothetical protein
MKKGTITNVDLSEVVDSIRHECYETVPSSVPHNIDERTHDLVWGQAALQSDDDGKVIWKKIF